MALRRAGARSARPSVAAAIVLGDKRRFDAGSGITVSGTNPITSAGTVTIGLTSQQIRPAGGIFDNKTISPASQRDHDSDRG